MLGHEQCRKIYQCFNAIENYLRRNLEARNFISFFNLIDDASQDNLIVRQYREELRLFGNLRNAIIHSDRKHGRPVADPREDVVEQIEKIVKMLLDPPLVSQHLITENGRRDEPIIGIITISEDLEMIIDVLRGSGNIETVN